MIKPKYCPCIDNKPDPCPACGATLSGNDEVHGICQATHGVCEDKLEVILVRKEEMITKHEKING